MQSMPTISLPGMRADAHAVPELSLATRAPVEINRLAVCADAFVLHAAFELASALSAIGGLCSSIPSAGLLLGFDLIAHGLPPHYLAHGAVKVVDCLTVSLKCQLARQRI